MISEVSPSTNVTLNGSGNGQCALGPPSGTKWALRLATVSTSTAKTHPQCRLYRGSSSGPIELLDSTFTGDSASSGKVAGAPFYPGQMLWAVWTGGDAGAVATLQAYGQQGNRSDPLPPSPPSEGFDNSLATVVVSGPSGGQIIITTQIPADLNTYYTGLGLTPQAAILSYLSTNVYEYRVLLPGAAVAEGIGGRGGPTPVAEAWRITDQGAAGTGFNLAAANNFDIGGVWTVDNVNAGRGFVSTANVDITADTTAVGTVETVLATLPALTYRAGRAYALRFRGALRSNTGAATVALNVRDTNTAGTVRGGTYRFNTLAAGSAGEVRGDLEHVVGNNTLADITGRVLCLTITSSSAANTVFCHAATPNLEAWLEVWDIGLVSDHPQAVPL